MQEHYTVFLRAWAQVITHAYILKYGRLSRRESVEHEGIYELEIALFLRVALTRVKPSIRDEGAIDEESRVFVFPVEQEVHFVPLVGLVVHLRVTQ